MYRALIVEDDAGIAEAIRRAAGRQDNGRRGKEAKIHVYR